MNLKWSLKALDQVVKSMLHNEGRSFVMRGTDLDQMWHGFKKHFVLIEAGGGVVKNSENRILFIYRNEKWDLPKGKLDNEETFETAAVREVKEECGFNSLQLGHFLQSTYHIYEERGQQVLKITQWYEMHSNENVLNPQLEEGITALSWESSKDLNKVLGNTYPNIKLLINNLDLDNSKDH